MTRSEARRAADARAHPTAVVKRFVTHLAIPIMVVLVGSVLSPFAAFAQPASLAGLMSAIDASRDPAVRWFSTVRTPESPHWYDHLRWSADASASYDYMGTASLATSASLTVPIDAFTEAGDRVLRARIEAELMALERDAAIRDLKYGVLDVACRVGYLRTIEPWMATLADGRGHEAELWHARLASVADELDALDAQLAASAPGLRSAMAPLSGFICLLPGVPIMDGLDHHPSLRLLALETAQEAYQLDVFRDTGGPELVLGGSLRYAAHTGEVDADIRVSARIPFSTTGALGSVTAETDPWGARIRVQIDASTLPERQASFEGLEHRLAQERASLSYQIASASASYRILQVQFQRMWTDVQALGLRTASECTSLCSLDTFHEAAPDMVASYLDVAGLGYEVARAQLELMRLLAIDPAVLDDSTPAVPTWADDSARTVPAWAEASESQSLERGLP